MAEAIQRALQSINVAATAEVLAMVLPTSPDSVICSSSTSRRKVAISVSPAPSRSSLPTVPA